MKILTALMLGALSGTAFAQSWTPNGTNKYYWSNLSSSLGIGTNDPQYTLDIASANSSQLRVKSTGGGGAPLIKFWGSYNGGNGAEIWQDATGVVRLNINSSFNALRLGTGGDVTANRFSTNSSYLQSMFTAEASGTRYLELRDGGTIRAFIDPVSAGNVAYFSQKMGIGISNPSARLQIEDNSANMLQILKTSLNYGGGVTSSNNSHELYATYGAGSTGNLTGLRVAINNQGSGKSYSAVFRGGYVGVGTDNPQYDVDVDGRVRTTHQGWEAVWGDTHPNGTAGVTMGNRDFGIRTQQSGNSMLTVKTNGWIGVGTNSPSAKFQVEDVTGNLTQLIKTNLNYQTGVSGSYNAHEFNASYGPGSTGNITGLRVAVSNAGNGKSYSAVFRGGYVGIGTDNPQFELDVDGAARFTGTVQVDGIRTKTWTVAPDYVFEKDYKMASLQEVESFVQKNKHLPDVPSAKTIKEKGLDLAEMNLLLLKKVEELTLHAIRQEKQVASSLNKMESQSEEIRRLKQSLSELSARMVEK